MKEYAVLPESLHNDRIEFTKWLERSFRYVSTLPEKEPKKAKKSAPGSAKKPKA